MDVSDKHLANKDRNGDDLVSVLEKFHKDFRKSADNSLRIDKARNEREIDVKKKQTLGAVSNTSISNVTNISSSTKDRSGANVSSVIIPPSKTDKETVDELKNISSTIVKTSQTETSKGKTILKNSILQAKIIEGAFNYIKDFFLGGVTDTDRIVHAINNVEQAVLNEDKIILDERSQFQKFTESMPDSSVIKQVSKSIPKEGNLTEKITTLISALTKNGGSAVSGFVDNVKGAGASVTDTKGKSKGGGSVIGDFIESIMDTFSTISDDPKVKKKTKESASGVASMFAKYMEDGVDSVLGSKLLNKKSGFLGAVALFGDSADFAMSTAILNPLKTLKLAYRTFSKSLGVLVDRPLLQGIALSTSMFGGLGGALATFLLPLAKVVRPLTKELPSLGDAFSAARSKIADAYKGTKDFLTKHAGSMLKHMKKALGKKFLMAGVFLGGLGSMMLGVMGTMMVAASAIWAGIVAAAIAAFPFIVGGLIIAAILGIGYYIYKNWDKVKAKWHEYMVQPVIDFMISSVEKFKTLKEKITDAITGFFKSILDGARTAIEMLPFGDKIATGLFGEKKVVEPIADKFSPTVMGSAKGNTGQTVISKDNSQVISGKSEIIRDKTIIKENNEDNKKMMKNLDSTLKELSGNMNRQQQPIAPVPQSNVDDLGTLLVTMGG